MDKLLTIAIPTYNRADLLDKQLAWLAQAIKGFEADCEIFISDNCSTDNTQEVIKKWQQIITNVTFNAHQHHENIGLMKNLGFCISSSKTKYIWEIGDDDAIQNEALAYIISKLKKQEDLSLLFLNFSGRDQNTGEPVHPSGIAENRWFDIAREDGKGDGKTIFAHCFVTSIGAVMFLTATVYKTEVAQRGYERWKEGIDNLLFFAYLTGYCAANGAVIVTDKIYLECTIGVSSWQQNPASLMLIQNKYIPEILVQLEKVGYPEQFCRRLILEHFRQKDKAVLSEALKKWPLLTIKTTVSSFALVGASAFRLINLKLKAALAYRATRSKHARNLPILEAIDCSIVNAIEKEGVYCTTIEALDVNSTSNLLKAAYGQLSSMETEGENQNRQRPPQIYTLTDLPEFAAWGKEQRLLNIIENYIGLPVTFQGVHLRKHFPNENQFGPLLWHKDLEDRRIVKIIIYLNDVEEKHGPFEYVPRPLTSLSRLSSYRISYKILKAYSGITDETLGKIIPKSAWKRCPGKAGTVIFADTKNTLSHDTVSTEERSALVFVYTANPPSRPEHCSQYWDDTYARPDYASELI